MSNLVVMLIQLASGALGGNLAGSLFKKISMGTLWNSILGILGGGLGGELLESLTGNGVAGADFNSIIGNILGGGVGGGVLMAIVSVIKSALTKKK